MPWKTTRIWRGVRLGRYVKTSSIAPPRSTACSPLPGTRIAFISEQLRPGSDGEWTSHRLSIAAKTQGFKPCSKPDVHRQSVAVSLVRGSEARRRAGGDQGRRATDGNGVEDVVARRTRQAIDPCL